MSFDCCVKECEDGAGGYRRVGHGESIVHKNDHAGFLDRVEVGAVDGEEAAAGSEAVERFDLHHGGIFGVGERGAREDPLGVVDGHRQLGDAVRGRRPGAGAQEPRARGVAAVDQTRKIVQERRHAAAHVQVRSADGQQSPATLRTEGWEHATQLQILPMPPQTQRKSPDVMIICSDWPLDGAGDSVPCRSI